MAMPSPEQRIEELEIRIAHHEKTLGELNDVITEQWKLIESLKRHIQRVEEEVQALDSTSAPPIQKPPHY